MNTRLIVGLIRTVLPRVLGSITGLAGYRDRGKTGALSALFDGSKFTAVVVILLGLGVSMMPPEIRTALLEVVGMLATDTATTPLGG